MGIITSPPSAEEDNATSRENRGKVDGINSQIKSVATFPFKTNDFTPTLGPLVCALQLSGSVGGQENLFIRPTISNILG